ncbi:hypothetical protein QYE76_050746 [Lolium multiflorum]|uniref:G-patch domain-containing protein n=1 Tax=Lolium multiflorum TaxID=4521 RepID=A0AAD8WHA5_LOLMU|nr:hypothetical protein QYE76_050746 [Lolium multiflorum]
MEAVDQHHQIDDAIDAASSDPATPRRRTNPLRFVSAGMWHGQSIAEKDRDKQLRMAARRRLAYVEVTDPGAGLPPGYLEHSKGARMLAAMGYKVGMGIGKDPGIRIPVERPRPPKAGLGGIQDASGSTADC